ncbi:MAG: hypothetical protein PWQ29_1016 [Verrucomicrobiota bacterium]|jgi:GxxExxY protein|nr:hypothetical protein [Verrucomicrobiota bacterium]MDK2963622.1 hypothetical protein [Verrucomicrobiota bacterium]
MTDQKIRRRTDNVRETAYAVPRFFGPGHFEKGYENALVHRLKKARIPVLQQMPITVHDEEGTVVGEYIADWLIGNELIIELKAGERLTGNPSVSKLWGTCGQ